MSNEGTATVNLGIVEIINLRRTQEIPIIYIRRKGEWHTL